MAWFYLDPQAKLDFGHDWTVWLTPGDVIADSTWSITPTGPTLDNSTHGNTSTTIWVSGGTIGVSYLLVNHITTAQGRQDDRSVTLRCQQR